MMNAESHDPQRVKLSVVLCVQQIEEEARQGVLHFSFLWKLCWEVFPPTVYRV